MRSIFAVARQAALDLEALVLPVACLGCARAMRVGAGVLCEQCRAGVRPIAPPKCGRCGHTLDAWERKDDRRPLAAGTSARTEGPAANGQRPATCGFCRTWPDALTWAASAVRFDDVARELVHALKYGGWPAAADPMALIMTRQLGAELRRADLLVPVPLGRHRARARGYNQAEELAGALSRRTGVALAVDALVRSRETRTQTTLDPAQRRANVSGAFLVRGEPCAVRGKNVMLIDDVLTTGATLGAAAEALAAAGASQVGAVTFARAAKPE